MIKSSNYVLIVSDENDSTTDDVLLWMRYKKINFRRINRTDIFSLCKVEINAEKADFELVNSKLKLENSSIHSYWYRRGRVSLSVEEIIRSRNNKLNQSIRLSIDQERYESVNFIHSQLEDKHGIGSIYENDTNKLQNLVLAKKVGFIIPDTLITSSREQLLEFRTKHEKILTKPIAQGGLIYSEEDFKLDGGSVILSDDLIESLPEIFPPSLFQGYIEKAYELRIFYLHGECYSMAIFSQLDEKTKVDFRNYNFERPNRTPPYKLPENIEKQIIDFMKLLKMDSGSIDIIVTPRKEFIFLEVNPVGQFFQVSYPCNYYLEERISDYLSKGI